MLLLLMLLLLLTKLNLLLLTQHVEPGHCIVGDEESELGPERCGVGGLAIPELVGRELAGVWVRVRLPITGFG